MILYKLNFTEKCLNSKSKMWVPCFKKKKRKFTTYSIILKKNQIGRVFILYRCINEHFKGEKTIIFIFTGDKSLSLQED